MKNRIDQLFQTKKEDILNIYFTAGFPSLHDTRTVLKALQDGGADLVEIGIPFSDPTADGPTIQVSNQKALDNGMSLHILMEQLKGFRSEVDVPVVMMGYVNPIVQYGLEEFCKDCQEVGIDGLILPDLPMQEYLDDYKAMFESYGLHNIFLITPQTSDERIKMIDEHSSGFIYMVSSASTTGAKKGISSDQEEYFKKIASMKLKHPRLIGFGISDHESFKRASLYADGAIIGSAFIKMLEGSDNLSEDVKSFVQEIKG